MSKEIFTRDKKMLNLLKVAETVATSKASILITGESGTGKEMLARYIHDKSNRENKPYIAINCAAVPENLLESELFGYEKGAFTGADHRKIGKFEMANEGTLLLDEIGEMPYLLQAKILRALQEGEITRLGGDEVLRLNVRVISATNKNLSLSVKNNKFREDLFYRLNVIPLHIPPLRERIQDIELLSRLFIQVVCEENKISEKELSESALSQLMSWNWPGNVRELQNTIERSVLLSENFRLFKEDIKITRELKSESTVNLIRPGMTVSEAEKALILKTLEFTQQNRTKAAQLLGISIRTLRNKINFYSKEGRL